MKNKSRIIRSAKTENYTIISNDIIQSVVLTPEEKSLLIRMLSKPKEWIFYKTRFWKETEMSKGKCLEAWNALVHYGYITETKRLQNNLVVGHDYKVVDEPKNGHPTIALKPRKTTFGPSKTRTTQQSDNPSSRTSETSDRPKLRTSESRAANKGESIEITERVNTDIKKEQTEVAEPVLDPGKWGISMKKIKGWIEILILPEYQETEYSQLREDAGYSLVDIINMNNLSFDDFIVRAYPSLSNYNETILLTKLKSHLNNKN